MTIEYTTPLSNVRVSSAGLMIANADLIHIAIDLYRLGRALPNCALRDSLLHTDEEVLLTAEGAIQTLEYVGFDFESIGIDLAHLNFTATWEWFPLNDLYVGDAIMLLDFLKPYLSSPAPNEHPTIAFTDKALSKLFVEFPANKDTGNIYRVAKDGLPTTRTPINIIQRFNDLASLNRATETLNSIYKDFVDMEEDQRVYGRSDFAKTLQGHKDDFLSTLDVLLFKANEDWNLVARQNRSIMGYFKSLNPNPILAPLPFAEWGAE